MSIRETSGYPRGKNADYSWNDFDPEKYRDHNYLEMRSDDRRMLEAAVRWFSKAQEQRARAGQGDLFRHGFDAGAGSNLYPALAMLAFCERLTLLEFSSKNVEYLESQVLSLDDSWEQFWGVVSPYAGNRDFAWAKRRLFERATVRQGSILTDAPVREFDAGTMAFVSCSLSEDFAEFETATKNFIGALEPGSAFFDANMENSVGYEVDGIRYPATPVDPPKVRACLSPLSTHLNVRHFDIDPEPVHPGYTGYVVSTGLTV